MESSLSKVGFSGAMSPSPSQISFQSSLKMRMFFYFPGPLMVVLFANENYSHYGDE